MLLDGYVHDSLFSKELIKISYDSRVSRGDSFLEIVNVHAHLFHQFAETMDTDALDFRAVRTIQPRGNMEPRLMLGLVDDHNG